MAAPAGESEYVPFASECSCEGPVEVWLQNVVDAMRSAVSAEFKAAMPAYAEKARTQWIFENSAQNTVVVSRAFFTAEVNEAFTELENGNEDALKVRSTPQASTQLYSSASLRLEQHFPPACYPVRTSGLVCKLHSKRGILHVLEKTLAYVAACPQAWQTPCRMCTPSKLQI